MVICVFGDSITWGASDYEKGGWVERLKIDMMENTDDTNIYNVGVPDTDTNDLLRRFDVEAEARQPNIVIFAMGINDSQYIDTKDNPRVDLEKFKSNVSELIKKARKFTEKIIFVGLTKVDEPRVTPVSWNKEIYYDNERVNQYDAALLDTCDKENLKFIKLFDLLDNADLEDGLHPNAAGHQKIYKKVRGEIDGWIE